MSIVPSPISAAVILFLAGSYDCAKKAILYEERLFVTDHKGKAALPADKTL